MTIDNQLNSARYRLFFIILLTVIGVSVLFYIIIEPRYIELYILAVVLSAAFLLYLYMLLKNYYFIYASITNTEMTLRYFLVHPALGTRKSIIISAREFYNYKIVKKLFGLQKYIVLYQRTPRGIAKYPPLSVTAFSQEDFQEFTNQLDALIKGV